MISKSVLAFIEKVNQDPSLHAKVAGEPRLDIMVKVAGENGFNFTPDEWIGTVQALYAPELSEEDLAVISGGGTSPFQLPTNPLGLQASQLGNLLPGSNASGVPPFTGH
ncbi:MAG TPA: Nif11-like leader peptide family RiPP precursor [Aggregatilineales bacterium]|nr:Nif11-like leader peptide family RiPP precursor [Aggregatilineales bacterium]